MKGLLYKEWCLQKKTILSFVVLACGFSLLGVLVFLSMKCGNLKSWPQEDPQSVTLFLVTFTYAPYLLLLLSSEVCNSSVCSDYGTGWMKFSYTLPTKSGVAVGARYVFGCLVMAASCVYGVINALVIYAFAGEAFDVAVFKYMLFILVGAVAVFTLFMPLSYKLKKSRTVSAVGGVFVMIMYFCLMGLFLYGNEKYGDDVINKAAETFKQVCDVMSWISPLIIILLLGVSFTVSTKIYQRREKQC